MKKLVKYTALTTIALTAIGVAVRAISNGRRIVNLKLGGKYFSTVVHELI